MKTILVLSCICVIPLALLFFSAGPILTLIGGFPVVDQKPAPAQAAVVLYTGVDYYPRLIEAARLYREKWVKTVVIDGNRKTDVLRDIEKKGFAPCCHWAENYIRILELHGVARADIMAVSAEDVFDTISEARAVGQALLAAGIDDIVLTTSKSHTRRARHIWRAVFKEKMTVAAAAATSDPYTPSGWWKDGRQIRWVMAEYGAWGYYLWQALLDKIEHR